jgi:hypothetical protein
MKSTPGLPAQGHPRALAYVIKKIQDQLQGHSKVLHQLFWTSPKECLSFKENPMAELH